MLLKMPMAPAKGGIKMSVGLLHTLSLVAYILAGLFLLVSVALFFRFKVPELIGDISGANAKKAIESIRKQNEDSGSKVYSPSHVNLSRGKLTAKMSASGKLQRNTRDMGVGVRTEKISTQKLMYQTEATTLLEQISPETTVLMQPQETTVLPQSQETTLLYPDNSNGGFSVDVDMCFMGSNEVIE